MADKSDDPLEIQYTRESMPEGVPPPGDPAWLKKEQRAGTLPDPKRRGVQAGPLLRKTESTAPNSRNQRDYVYRIDKTLSEEDYRKVYEAYGETGELNKIVEATGLKTKQVNHLIDKGLLRLGLPAIREHAVDLAEVNTRLQDAVAIMDKSPSKNFLATLPDVQKAVTDRATREAAAAQSLLSSAMSASQVILEYVNKVFEKAQIPGAMEAPDIVTGGTLETLSKTVNNMTKAVDSAVRLSRLTAGEPESNLGVEVTVMINKMSDDELQWFLEHQQLPPRLRIGGGGPPSNDESGLDPIDVEFSAASGDTND